MKHIPFLIDVLIGCCRAKRRVNDRGAPNTNYSRVGARGKQQKSETATIGSNLWI